MKKYILVMMLLVGSGALIAFKLASNKHKIELKNHPAKRANIKIPVTTITVSTTIFRDTIVKSGVLAPISQADIISSVQGKITGLTFAPGSYVTKGTVLAKIDTRLKEISLQNIHQQVEKLEEDYKTYQELLAGDGTTQSKVNEIKLSLENAKNQQDQLNKQIKEYNIVAPFSGMIVLKNSVPGEFVNPGAVIGKLVDVSKLKVLLMIGENEVYDIRPGQYVTIHTGVYPGQEFNAKVIFISPQGDDTHNYPIEAVMNNSSEFPLKAGTSVYADFTSETLRHIIHIPKEAMIESAAGPCVYIYQAGLAKARQIQVGRGMGDNIEVTGGLKEGDQVIVSGKINLQNNTPVQLANQ